MNPAAMLTDRNPQRSLTTADRLARGLGWFSLGLGLVELVAPGRLARALGLEGRETLLRAYGGREVAAGVGALSIEADVAVWSRVAGDVVDLGTLAVGLKAADRAQRRNGAIALAAVAAVLAVDLAVASTLTKQRSRSRGRNRDYSDRSGFPQGTAAARGAAREATIPPPLPAAPQAPAVH